MKYNTSTNQIISCSLCDFVSKSNSAVIKHKQAHHNLSINMSNTSIPVGKKLSGPKQSTRENSFTETLNEVLSVGDISNQDDVSISNVSLQTTSLNKNKDNGKNTP